MTFSSFFSFLRIQKIQFFAVFGGVLLLGSMAYFFAPEPVTEKNAETFLSQTLDVAFLGNGEPDFIKASLTGNSSSEASLSAPPSQILTPGALIRVQAPYPTNAHIFYTRIVPDISFPESTPAELIPGNILHQNTILFFVEISGGKIRVYPLQNLWESLKKYESFTMFQPNATYLLFTSAPLSFSVLTPPQAPLHGGGVLASGDFEEEGDPNLGLRGEWKMDGDLRNAVNGISDLQHPLSPEFVPSAHDQALHITGKENGILWNGGNFSLGKAVTLEAWFQAKPGEGFSKILEVGKNHETATGIGIDSLEMGLREGIRYWITLSGKRYESVVRPDTNYHDGAWHYVVLAYDKGVVRLYIDGKEESAKKISGVLSADPVLYIASSPEGEERKNEIFSGNIDEVRFFQRGLSTGEVLRRALLP